MENDGFEVPIHRSVTEPILVAGVPREVMIINLTSAGVFILGAHIWLSAPIFLIIHWVAVYATKKDAQFFEAFLRHLQQKSYYDA
jgi:type IV secretory pathway TrbD component